MASPASSMATDSDGEAAVPVAGAEVAQSGVVDSATAAAAAAFAEGALDGPGASAAAAALLAPASGTKRPRVVTFKKPQPPTQQQPGDGAENGAVQGGAGSPTGASTPKGGGSGGRKTAKRQRGGAAEDPTEAFAPERFVDPKPMTADKDAWGLAPWLDVRSGEFLSALAKACDDSKKKWASLTFTGPSISRNFPGLLECFPCSNPVCTRVSYRNQNSIGGSPGAGGKMFCLLRFMLDPEHLGPLHTLDAAMGKLSYGKEIRRLIGAWVKSFNEKREAQGWGTTALDDLKIFERLSLIAEQGDCTAFKENVKAQVASASSARCSGPAFDALDPEQLDQLMEECVAGRSSWAHLGHIGPAINNNFRGLLECFPCSDAKCIKAKGRGGGKMFCTLRFLMDPGHVQPQLRLKSALRSFKYGKEIQKLADLYVKTFESKRSAHNWGTLKVDQMGLLRAVERVAEKGDISDLLEGKPQPKGSAPPDEGEAQADAMGGAAGGAAGGAGAALGAQPAAAGLSPAVGGPTVATTTCGVAGSAAGSQQATFVQIASAAAAAAAEAMGLPEVATQADLAAVHARLDKIEAALAELSATVCQPCGMPASGGQLNGN